MNKLIVYIHGKGGSAEEAEHYKALFKNCDVIGFDYTARSHCGEMSSRACLTRYAKKILKNFNCLLTRWAMRAILIPT